MANKRIEIMDIRQLLILKQKGTSNRQVAQLLSTSRNTVNSYVRVFEGTGQSWASLQELSDPELEALYCTPVTEGDQRYTTLSGYFNYYAQELAKTGCTYQVLWQEYKEKHADGYGYTRFKYHLQSWLRESEDGSMHMEHKAGDKLFVDFTGKKLHLIDKSTGELQEVEVFVGILGCSQYTYVQAVNSQQKEDFLGALSRCLEYMGGVPQAIVPDNLRSAVDKSCKYEPVVNKTFRAFGLHYSTALMPTRSYSPQDKAMVERAVKLVYQRIFYKLSKMEFFSLADLNKQIGKLLHAYNYDYRFQHRDYSRGELFEQTEKELLQPLPCQRFEIIQYKRGKVQKIGHIWFGPDKHYYSVPYQYIGKQVEVQYTSSSLEIYYNKERIAMHQRDKQPGGYTTVKDHLSSAHRFVSEWNPDKFINWAAGIGTPVKEYIEELIRQRPHPEQAYLAAMGILKLAKTFSNQRLIKACERAAHYQWYSFRTVKNILNKGLDQLGPEQEPDLFSDQNIEHENLRGPEYYQ